MTQAELPNVICAIVFHSKVFEILGGRRHQACLRIQHPVEEKPLKHGRHFARRQPWRGERWVVPDGVKEHVSSAGRKLPQSVFGGRVPTWQGNGDGLILVRIRADDAWKAP